MSEMSESIYHEVMDTEEQVKMMMDVDIYENPDSVRNQELMIDTENISTERHQPLQHTGSVSVKNRRHRAGQVCLWLLCVLLLTAVLVLCVCFSTERKRLLTHNYNLIKEREQLKNKSDELQRGLYEHDQRSDSFNWIYYNFSFYYFSSDWRSWSDSRRDCKDRGADLVIINSKEEQKFLQINVFSKFWIGLHKEEDMWKWVDGTTVLSRYWRNGLPKSYNNLCAITDASGLADHSCNSKFRGICEKRILKTSSYDT